jgi:hypothetical protein
VHNELAAQINSVADRLERLNARFGKEARAPAIAAKR